MQKGRDGGFRRFQGHEGDVSQKIRRKHRATLPAVGILKVSTVSSIYHYDIYPYLSIHIYIYPYLSRLSISIHIYPPMFAVCCFSSFSSDNLPGSLSSLHWPRQRHGLSGAFHLIFLQFLWETTWPFFRWVSFETINDEQLTWSYASFWSARFFCNCAASILSQMASSELQ